jgi:hypothetical protein
LRGVEELLHRFLTYPMARGMAVLLGRMDVEEKKTFIFQVGNRSLIH